MDRIVRGNPIVFEATVNEYTPFGSLALSDPAVSIKITVTDPNGQTIINAQSMTKSTTGKYYYIYQTTSSSPIGLYAGNVAIDDDAYDGIYISAHLAQVVASND